MSRLKQLLVKVRFYSSALLLNTAALLFAMYLFLPAAYGHIYAYAFPGTIATQPSALPLPAVQPLPKTVISGVPTRIEIIAPDNGMHTDLSVAPGYYDEHSQSWTLNNNSAFFATPSVPANDTRGTTLIYGHSEPAVFGYLNSIKPGVGAYALVHTDTGKVFRYSYQDARNLRPDDTSIFTGTGTPTLVVQTCAGDWFQYRRMYRFSYEGLAS
jgi:hypothetical protein